MADLLLLLALELFDADENELLVCEGFVGAVGGCITVTGLDEISSQFGFCDGDDGTVVYDVGCEFCIVPKALADFGKNDNSFVRVYIGDGSNGSAECNGSLRPPAYGRNKARINRKFICWMWDDGCYRVWVH